jgi:tryptophan halogenase
MDKRLSICIVGGGTAGWLTALYVNRLLPNAEIKVVESSEIGIIGAGEGSTISLITFLQDLDISLGDIIKYTDATVKLGIKFANWNGDSTYYYHPFGPYLGKHSFNLSNFNIGLERTKSTTTNDDSRLYLGLASVSNENLTHKILNNILSEKNKVSILDTNSVASLHALHFDSFKLGSYLKQIGLKRGILLIEDEVVDVNSDTVGNITTLLTKTTELNADFFFDCSGFARLLIGKKYNTSWIDYSKHLLVDTAIPFHQPEKTEIEPYTTATAMNAGWLWEIPIQSRIGSGYIYSSKHITDEDALTELSKHL